MILIPGPGHAGWVFCRDTLVRWRDSGIYDMAEQLGMKKTEVENLPNNRNNTRLMFDFTMGLLRLKVREFCQEETTSNRYSLTSREVALLACPSTDDVEYGTTQLAMLFDRERRTFHVKFVEWLERISAGDAVWEVGKELILREGLLVCAYTMALRANCPPLLKGAQLFMSMVKQTTRAGPYADRLTRYLMLYYGMPYCLRRACEVAEITSCSGRDGSGISGDEYTEACVSADKQFLRNIRVKGEKNLVMQSAVPLYEGRTESVLNALDSSPDPTKVLLAKHSCGIHIDMVFGFRRQRESGPSPPTVRQYANFFPK